MGAALATEGSMSKRREPGVERRDRVVRARVARLLEQEEIAELEIVFELYCALWERAGELPRRAAVPFVLDGLAHSGVSEPLVQVLGQLRALPFVESAAGPAADRDSTWFGLQIMLNDLLLRKAPLLAPEWHARAAASRASAPRGPRAA
jgi:hypothetical protein